VAVRRTALFVVCLLFASLYTIPTHAQGVTDKIEVFGGYSFMHYDFSPSFNTNGWELSGEYKMNHWLGGVADVDGHYGTFQGVSSHLDDYLFGPQVSFPAPVSPFARVLIGGAHFGANGVTNNSFAYGLGFGIDTSILPQIKWRIVQLDVIHSHLFDDGQSNTRVSTGIVIHF
jgi:hypothetical protein